MTKKKENQKNAKPSPDLTGQESNSQTTQTSPSKASVKSDPEQDRRGWDIYTKLWYVRCCIPALPPEAFNDFHNYRYISSAQILITVRDEIDRIGLMLIPNLMGEPKVQKHSTKDGGKQQFFTEISIQYTWVNIDNPDERITCAWAGQGLDDAEKGIGKAYSYAEKSFLLKFFNIAAIEEDSDRPRKRKFSETKGQDFDYLQTVGDIKKRLDEAEYYRLLEKFDCAHANQLKPSQRQNFYELILKIKDRNERFIAIMLSYSKSVGQNKFTEILNKFTNGSDLMDNKGYPIITNLDAQKELIDVLGKEVSPENEPRE